MRRLKKTKTVTETDALKEKKKLKDNDAFKILIYALFFISCAASFIFAYFFVAEYYIGAYEEDSSIQSLSSSINYLEERHISNIISELVVSYLDDMSISHSGENYTVAEGIEDDEVVDYYVDAEDIDITEAGVVEYDGTVAYYTDVEKIVENMDTNGDDTVDETDWQKYLINNADLFCDEYGLEVNSDVISEKGYADVKVSMVVGDETVINEEWSNVPEYWDTSDYSTYTGAYFVDLLNVEKFDNYTDMMTYWNSIYDSPDICYYAYPDEIFDFDYDDFIDGEFKISYNGVEYEFTELAFSSDYSDYISYADGTYIFWDDYSGTGTFYPAVSDGYTVCMDTFDAINIYYEINTYIYVSDLYNVDDNNGAYLSFVGNRYNYVVALIISVIACICFMVVSMMLSGSKNGLRIIEKIPAEIILIAFGALPILSYSAFETLWYDWDLYIDIYSCLEVIEDIVTFLRGNILSHGILIFVFLVGMACVATLGLLLINNIIARIKNRSLLKTLIIVRICKVIFINAKNIALKIPFKLKAVILYSILTFVEIVGLICLMSIGSEGLCVLVYIILKVIIILGMLLMIYNLYVLAEGGEKLAEGDYSYKVDTKYMIGDFKKHGENLNNINVGMQNAVEERIKSERMKAELITNVSHDIKTPVTSIVNYVDLLEKENIEREPEKSYIEVLKRQSLRLKKLVEDLVEASKASTGNITMELAPVDANMLIEQASAEYIDKLSTKNITVIKKLSADKASIMADGKYLWRVFDNLLNNAFKYAMPATRMYITTYITDENGGIINDIATSMKKPARVVIEFKNISKDELNISSNEIMERFVRGDSSRNTEGSGLGLSIAKNLCQLQNAAFDIIIDGDLFKACITFNYSPDPTPADLPESSLEPPSEALDN